MRYFTILLFTIIIGFSVAGCSAEAETSPATDTQNVADSEGSADTTEDKQYLCYIGCLEAEGTQAECNKECYGETDVVDTSGDVTNTSTDTVSVPVDASGTSG